jgi:hypothetical protein
MIDLKNYTDRELIQHQSYLRDAIRRSKKGWLHHMSERWQDIKADVETEMKGRGLVTTIKFENVNP